MSPNTSPHDLPIAFNSFAPFFAAEARAEPTSFSWLGQGFHGTLDGNRRMESRDVGKKMELLLGGGFKYLLFSPVFGEDFKFDYMIFFRWVETTNQVVSPSNQNLIWVGEKSAERLVYLRHWTPVFCYNVRCTHTHSVAETHEQTGVTRPPPQKLVIRNLPQNELIYSRYLAWWNSARFFTPSVISQQSSEENHSCNK